MRAIAKTAKIPQLPEDFESLDLSKQQKQICAMVLQEHLSSVEVAKRLQTTPKAIRIQIGRIWQKAENKTNKMVNAQSSGVNHAQNTQDPEAIKARFSTQVQRISYLNQIGFKNRQIAEVLGIKDSNVKQVLSRSKRQTISRRFLEPVPINPSVRPRNPVEEAVLLDGARMFYNKFVSGTNKAPAREVLRGLHLTGQGGREGARIALGDRARIMRLLSALSHCKDVRSEIVRVDEDDREVRRVCGAVLSKHFKQILPGHYKPKDGVAIALLRSTLQSSVAETAETGN